ILTMQRYTKFPVTVFRIQAKLPVSLCDFEMQTAKGRTSYDFKQSGGLVQPMAGDVFHTPGMSLRQLGPKMIGILENFKGEPRVYRMQEGTAVPPKMTLIHERSDHYLLQVAEPMPLPEFNDRLSRFLETLPSSSKADILAAWNEDEEQDN
ncbi:hypothetical protein HDU82_003893, partial [Entophlyctis luteolus]